MTRYFIPLTLGLLALEAGLQIASIRQEAQTWDEGIHLAAGLSYWRTGDYRMDSEHSPLALYTNKSVRRRDPFPARSVTILLTMLLGLSITLGTRTRFGPVATVIALTLIAFDPNVIAHDRYVATDLAVTLFSFLCCIVWARALERGTAASYALAGLTLGLALGSKFSALFRFRRWCFSGLSRRLAGRR